MGTCDFLAFATPCCSRNWTRRTTTFCAVARRKAPRSSSRRSGNGARPGSSVAGLQLLWTTVQNTSRHADLQSKRPVLIVVARRLSQDPAKRYKAYEEFWLSALAVLNNVLGAHYVVLSEHLRRIVGKRAPARPIDVIPIYGVDARIFTLSTQEKTVIRAGLGLPTTGAPSSSSAVGSRPKKTSTQCWARLTD